MTMVSRPNPKLVDAPTGELVNLAELKQHLRVTDDAEDELIQSLRDAAVAQLDGWQGTLGRPILAQRWEQEFPGWGDLQLALPNVTNFSIAAVDQNDQVVAAASSTLIERGGVFFVRCDGPAVEKVTIRYDCEMPTHMVPRAKTLVSMMVANWFENRSGVIVGTIVEQQPFAIQQLMHSLRWRVT